MNVVIGVNGILLGVGCDLLKDVAVQSTHFFVASYLRNGMT